MAIVMPEFSSVLLGENLEQLFNMSPHDHSHHRANNNSRHLATITIAHIIQIRQAPYVRGSSVFVGRVMMMRGKMRRTSLETNNKVD